MPRRPIRTPDTPNTVEWPAGVELWRVARDHHGLRPSVSPARSNRFSPVLDARGAVIPAWYGSTTTKGAIFETVFHDVRTSDREPRVLPPAYVDRTLAPVRTVRAILLIDLTTTGLHAIGLSRARLIESRPTTYQWTRSIAARLLAAIPDADGMTWVSRADDTSRSAVLYLPADRPSVLEPDPTRAPLALGAGAGLSLVRQLATDARITLLVPDR